LSVQHFDAVVVGSGFGGSVTAYRLAEAGQTVCLLWMLPNLAVTFANGGDPSRLGEPIREARPNIHGAGRDTCRLCGECDIGCNYGSKNTLDYTYLTEAWHAGADIRTRSEVRAFEPRDGGGYAVRYIHHDEAAEGHQTDTAALPPQTVSCDRLILSAGALGTTFLLLRNRAALPRLSPALGTLHDVGGRGPGPRGHDHRLQRGRAAPGHHPRLANQDGLPHPLRGPRDRLPEPAVGQAGRAVGAPEGDRGLGEAHPP
jgi:hypothetical protein